MIMDPKSMYVIISNEDIKNCGTIDCGCEIVKVKSPYETIKLCKTHKKEIINHDTLFKDVHISPMIDNPEKFETLHLAAIGSKEFD